jgi:hypothetical protein
MPGAGFIGTGPARHRGRSGENGAKSITATVLPASSPLVVGETLGDTVNWAIFTAPANYATVAPGEAIAGVQVNYIGDVGSAAEPLADGDINAFSVTVTDTAGTARTFSTISRTVVYTAPAVSGGLSDQSFAESTGVQTYDTSGGFAGDALGYSVSGPAGVTIDSGTGVVAFDTDVMALQSGTSIVVTATNSGGSAQSAFSLDIVAAEITATVAPATSVLVVGDTLQDTTSWSVFLDPANYATSVPGESIDSVTVNYIGSTPDATTAFADGDNNEFLVTVTDTAGVTRTFTTVSRTVVYAAPTASGELLDQSFAQNRGVQTYDASGDFTGDALSYSVSGPAGVTIDSGTGVVAFDTDVMALQSGTSIVVTATNSGGAVQSGFSLDIVAAEITATVAPATQSLSTGDTLNTIINYATITDTANYSSTAGIITSVEVQVDGVAQAGSFKLWGLEAVTVVVTDSAANSRTWTIDAEVLDTAYRGTYETTAPGETFTLSFRDAGTYAGTVDMGDGSGDQAFSTFNDAAFTATQATPGTYTFRVRGQATGPRFALGVDSAKLRTIDNLGALGWSRMDGAFADCTGITSITTGNTDLSGVNLYANFASNCDALTTVDLRGAGISPGNMRVMLNGCDSLATVLGFEEFDTSGMVRADEVFNTAPSMDFTQLDLSGWNLESLSTQGSMFNFLPDDGALLQSVYDAWLIALDAQTLTPGIFLGLGSTPYTTGGAAEAARTSLIGTKAIRIEDAGNAPPEQMGAPTLTTDGETQLTVTLAADPFTNGLPILNRDLRYSADLVNWTTQSNVVGPVVLTGLDADTQYHIQTRANNYNGTGAWSVPATATTAAGAQPFAATRTGTDLVLTDVPDISPQTFTAEAQGSDLVITFTGTIYAPAPTQVAIIDAANHNGTDPDAGSYDVRIFDLGAGVNNVYTLPGVSVPGGAMAVLLHPETDVVGGGFEEFERVVFIGASIMAQTFGSSLSQRNATAEAAFAANGAEVEVYAHAASGFDAGQVQALLSEAMATFPDKTLFFVHAGGNNVTANRPYPGGEAALAAQLNGLIDIAAARPGSVILSDLTFRDYGDTTAKNEPSGSKPYNDTIYLPAFRARQAALLSRAYYADGTPVSCLYEWSWEARDSYLSADNIHPANPGGRDLLRDWLAARLAPICLGLPAPAQFTRTLPLPAPAIDIFVEYGVRTAAGVNTPAVASIAGSGQTAEGPFVLLNTDGSDPGVSLTLNFSAPAPGNNSGFGVNTVGNGDGAAGFDGTLYNDVFTGDSYFAGAAYALDHVISGLAANTVYTVELVASRNATDSRETRYTFADGQTVTIQTTADPTQAPVAVDTVSDGSGVITITQSAVSGSWSYLGGLHITTT